MTTTPPARPRGRLVRRPTLPGGPDSVRARLERLEAEVQENRRLQRRVAELTDLVTELLVPLARRDEASLEAVLERYRALI
jgi:hypothetical protein